MQPRPNPAFLTSPNKLRADLADTRRPSIRDVAEGGAADVSAWVHELCMVEYVEEFTPKLQGHCFRNRDNLRNSEIRIVEARAMEEPAICGSKTPAIRTGQDSGRPLAIWEYESALSSGK